MGSDRGYGYANTRYLCAHHDSGSTFITNASGLSDKLEYLDHLQYFLYGAMIYMALKKWKRALFFLEIVIMSPANNTASMIQVEAYKKWVLVGLLLKGKVRIPSLKSFPAGYEAYLVIDFTITEDYYFSNSENLRSPR